MPSSHRGASATITKSQPVLPPHCPKPRVKPVAPPCIPSIPTGRRVVLLNVKQNNFKLSVVICVLLQNEHYFEDSLKIKLIVKFINKWHSLKASLLHVELGSCSVCYGNITLKNTKEFKQFQIMFHLVYLFIVQYNSYYLRRFLKRQAHIKCDLKKEWIKSLTVVS